MIDRALRPADTLISRRLNRKCVRRRVVRSAFATDDEGDAHDGAASRIS